MVEKHKPRRTGYFSCLIFVSLVGLLIIFLVYGSGRILTVADPLTRADAIVVLSGGDDSRLLEEINLYRENFADSIILTETGAFLSEYNTTYSREQRLVLINGGVPPTAIQVIGTHAASTREEAKLVRTRVANTDTHTLIVVTDPFHTLRTRFIWEDVFKDSGVELIIRPSRSSWYKPETWWMSTAGWKYTLNEFGKLAVYLITRVPE